ncbi:hypothetical protein CJF32_00008857 [Rutstroemia sp. NJR-2017a WRK4]|nr:hypothetical protein CJF32_00008857 [Rutstroemia sp. NJR-2017a WRK4]
MNILLSISEETTRHAIRGQLHKLLAHAPPTPNYLRIIEFPWEALKPPTKSEYLCILRDLKSYGTDHTRAQDWANSDRLARIIQESKDATGQEEILYRSLTLINIPDTSSVRFGEHTVSILTNSYSCFRGLNGTLGGEKHTETTADNNATNAAWRNGMAGLVKQGLYSINKDIVEQQFQDRKFYEEYKEPGSELEWVRDEEVLVERARQNCEAVYETAQIRITTLVAARVFQLQSHIELEGTLEKLGTLKAIREHAKSLRTKVDLGSDGNHLA